MSRWSVEESLKSSDVYSWERNEVSTSADCDVILVVEGLSAYQSDSGETGHVLWLSKSEENHSREWCDEDCRRYNNQMYTQQWVLSTSGDLISQFTFMQSLRIINVVEESPLLKQNANLPIWMEVNSGKSIQSLTLQSITLKHSASTIMEHVWTKHECIKRAHVYSSLRDDTSTL